MKHAVNRIHFIGIGGVGMSGIAEVLQNLSYKVSGSDMTDSTILRRLAQLGIKTYMLMSLLFRLPLSKIIQKLLKQKDSISQWYHGQLC
jgi:UDP-N-acetylmuramate-alanine ligase